MMSRKIVAAAFGTLLAASFALPAPAMPLPTPTVERQSDVTNAAKVIIKYGNYRGYRGYRYSRRGYRRHADGFWYPLAAFGPVIVIKPGRKWYWCGPRGNRHRCYR